MKQSLSAVVALALGVALAATAQAHGTSRSGAAFNSPMRPHHVQTGHRMPGQATVRQAQQQLKAQGLYRGPIDGMMGRQTTMALAKFQRGHGLRQTARLDRQTRGRLIGTAGTTGFGSSGPGHPRIPATNPPPTGAGGNGMTGQTPTGETPTGPTPSAIGPNTPANQ